MDNFKNLHKKDIMNVIKIGIVGTRRRDTEEDLQLVRKALTEIMKSDSEFIIISGGCPKGGDRFAEILAKEFKLKITIYYADWKRLGKSAGFQRNTYIAKDSDILIAVVAEDRKGGTEDTIKKFKKMHPNKEAILV